MSFIKTYYPILLEGTLFVVLLSLFEYVMYYLILAPDNKVKIQRKVERDVASAMEFDIDMENNEKIEESLRKNPLLAKLALSYIRNGHSKTDLKKAGYRYYLEQLDEVMQNENTTRFYGVTILILILFLLNTVFVLYGRFIIKVPFSLIAIFSSIFITYIFIIMMQLHFVYNVSPQFRMINNKAIEQAIYGFILGKPMEIEQTQ